MTTQKLTKKVIDEFVEKGAELEHDRWARWQKYMFSKGRIDTESGGLIIPKELVDRWTRQIDTPYSELSEEEKESDRKETRHYIPLLQIFGLRDCNCEYPNGECDSCYMENQN